MSERTEQFQVGDKPRLEVRIGSGDVVLSGGEPGSIVVTVRGSSIDDMTVEQRGNTVVVEQTGRRLFSRSIRVTAVVPADVLLEAKLGSADLIAHTTVREAEVAAGAGDIRIDTVEGQAEVATGAGDVTLGSVAGRLTASLASGDLSVEEVGDDLDARSAAGDLRVGRVAGRVATKTASGDVDVARFDGPELVAQSMSGDVRLGVPPGRTLDVDIQTLSGSVRNEFGLSDRSEPATGRPATLRVKTLSGDVVLRPARG